jgi:hypothetical protein
VLICGKNGVVFRNHSSIGVDAQHCGLHSHSRFRRAIGAHKRDADGRLRDNHLHIRNHANVGDDSHRS